MDFTTGRQLNDLCREQNQPISAIMKQREISHGELKENIIDHKLLTALKIMQDAVKAPLDRPRRSIGGMIGGEARQVYEFSKTDRSVCGPLLARAIAYSMAVLEVNASMGLIVAAPTAGSSGVVPGVLLALQDEQGLSDEHLLPGLLNAAAIGYLLMRNASVSGAEAGCQAEVGAASAMAASALVEIMQGTPEMCLNAASLALSNLLGLVCDPIAGLVEAPCQSRNTIGVANAITCAQLSLSGVKHPVPFDEMAEAMYRVGKSLPLELRETALGGNAATPTGCGFTCNGCEN